jgi:hypothetical protein
MQDSTSRKGPRGPFLFLPATMTSPEADLRTTENVENYYIDKFDRFKVSDKAAEFMPA